MAAAPELAPGHGQRRRCVGGGAAGRGAPRAQAGLRAQRGRPAAAAARRGNPNPSPSPSPSPSPNPNPNPKPNPNRNPNPSPDQLGAADQRFEDGLAAFEHAGDATNAALLQLNRATICRRRAAQRAATLSAASAVLAQLQPGAPPTDATADAGVMALRQQVLLHQRSAAARLRPLHGSQPALWASCLSQARLACMRAGACSSGELGHSVRTGHTLHARVCAPAPHLHPTCTPPAPRMPHPSQLAHDEGAAAGEVHAVVAEGRGGEEAIKSGADLLGRAQALHDSPYP